jgi:hypothetical protein
MLRDRLAASRSCPIVDCVAVEAIASTEAVDLVLYLPLPGLEPSELRLTRGPRALHIASMGALPGTDHGASIGVPC